MGPLLSGVLHAPVETAEDRARWGAVSERYLGLLSTSLSAPHGLELTLALLEGLQARKGATSGSGSRWGVFVRLHTVSHASTHPRTQKPLCHATRVDCACAELHALLGTRHGCREATVQ